MKRILIFSLCAVAVAAIGMNAAQAAVNTALNLYYTDPADPSDGGTWTLVAVDTDPNSAGIVALTVRFDDLAPAGTVNGSIGHNINPDNGNALVIGVFEVDETEFVFGQDPNEGLTFGVGLAGGPSDQGVDPLGNFVWDNASIIATGSFGSLRPSVVANSVEANVSVAGEIVAASIGLFNVRGDSLVTLGLESPAGAGLLAGDADRDGDVDLPDLGNLAGSLGGPGGWNDGDTDGDGDVDLPDLGALAGNLGSNGNPPAIGAVPEPTSIVLSLFGLSALAFRRRRA